MSQGLDLTRAVQYHYGRFPPVALDYGRLILPLSRAASALARYDQMLKSLHNSELLLAPLRNQEAVVSSRIEGTISTLDEVLRYEAEEEGESDGTSSARNDTVEVYLYARAMHEAQQAISDGAPFSPWLIRSMHKMLLRFGRGALMSPGEFKTEQNYLADYSRKRVLFIPIAPEKLSEGIERLFQFIEDESYEILIRTALAHLEFEALHPFKDGNGRIGRIMIPLMLWKASAISQPHFFISAYLDENRDEYIDRMRAASEHDDWVGWIIFFLQALEAQATRNLTTAENIQSLYAEMKTRFGELLSSRWSITAADFIFKTPVFRNSTFTTKTKIPPATAMRFTRTLLEADLLKTVVPAAGRRSAIYAFEPLLSVIRGR